MTMKMYNKSDLKLVNGMLVNAVGDIVASDPKVVEQANELETLAQKVAFLAKQPDATPMPSLDGFERESIDKNKVKFNAETPLLDLKAKESMYIMDELDDVKAAKHANEMADNFKELISFVSDECVIDFGGTVAKFDMPTLGSVLDLTVDDVTDVIATACGLERSVDDVVIKPGRITADELSEDELKALLDIIKNHDYEADDVVADSISIGGTKDVESE